MSSMRQSSGLEDVMGDTAPVLIGTSEAIGSLRRAVAVAGASDAKILITGDTGTGKDVVAQLVHAQSARAGRKFMALNCAGIPDGLLESELFGHERGSFTGAERDRDGLFTKAQGGTVLLDEVGETSPRMQAMLLRFLDSGEIQRVGSDSRTCVDVRLIAATNRDLAKSVAASEFRLDLFYRLNVLHLRTTALRERREDIPVLATHFLRACSHRYQSPLPILTAGAMDALVQYGWPGNVRELKNAAERLVVRRAGQTVGASDVSREINPPTPDSTASSGADGGRAQSLYHRLTAGHESYRSVVQGPYGTHDLTRDDIRSLVSRGLKATQGSHAALARLFIMDARAFTWTMKIVQARDRQLAVDLHP
jgi:transcriptional regulator with GAF, ATPase, and Fis domain